MHGARVKIVDGNILCVSEINSVLEINYEIGCNQRMK
jgi:hypothetical protein